MKKFVGLMIVAISALGLASCQGKIAPETSSGLNRVHFDFDSASIDPQMADALDGNARYLKKHKSVSVVIEGHCDQRGTNEYNLALGDRRATATEKYLSVKGVDSSRLKTVSYGEERPVDERQNESGWYLNRRAEFVRE